MNKKLLNVTCFKSKRMRVTIICAILSCTLLTGMTFPQNNTLSVDNYQNISNLLNYDNISLSKKQNFYHGNYSKNPQTSIAAYSKKVTGQHPTLHMAVLKNSY